MSNIYLCTVPRCGNTSPKPGRCPRHKRWAEAWNKRLKPRNKLYGTTRWEVTRLHVLQANPICVVCNQAVASQVDHIVPFQEGDNFFDLSNLQSLCPTCHSRKTSAEDGGFGNTKRRAY